MAERRMFAKTIIDSDAFLDMPLTAQLLYFHLAMRADDDGFVNKPKAIMRLCGCKDDDVKILFTKKFLIPFDSGVVVIKHWKIHNYIRKDTYTETKYKEEKSALEMDENNAYRLCDTNLLQVRDEPVTGTGTQDRLGKDRLGKRCIDVPKPEQRKRFSPPTLDEVKAYCQERKNNVDAERWFDYYTSNGWQVGKNKMKDWKAAVRTWERNGYSKEPAKTYGENGIAIDPNAVDDLAGIF